MRIAMLTYSTRPRGSVVHTLALAEALADLDHDVTVFALDRSEHGGGFFREVDERVRVRIVPCPSPEDLEARVLRSMAALAAAVNPADYDIVHAQDCIAANAVPGAIRTVHHVDRFTSPALIACHERAIMRPPSRVCVSEGVAAELRSDWGVDARVIPNGVESARFEAAAGPAGAATRAEWRAQLGTGPLVVTVGGIEPRKGSLDLLEAVARLRAVHPDARLVVAGGETLFDYRDYRAEFDARARLLDVDVKVLGPVDHNRLPALLAEADVFALASRREGFGLAAMEALAAGVPVVLRDGPVLGQVFAGAALFGRTRTELGKALVAALAIADPERRARGLALARVHTWERSARAHVEHYLAVAAEPAMEAEPANA